HDAGCRVIAEGRYNSPALAAEAIRYGAWAVTVGSAITRLEHICGWYNDALKKAAS
ncbi:N-acetylmannosamine-6-phosphate 2-epimerase, partial [Salmonella enterica subsp. enterica serovar Dublin]